MEVQEPYILSSLRILRRFVARSGIPELIIFDNQKKFMVAATQLTKIVNEPDVISFLLERKIQWKFNLGEAPWCFSFFLERMIKSSKRCRKKTLRKARLTCEELLTVLTEVECILQAINLSVSRRSPGSFDTISFNQWTTVAITARYNEKWGRQL